MAILTKQGLSASLYTAVEAGFRACERGDNLQKAIADTAKSINDLVAKATNCPKEIVRIRRVSR